MTNFSFDADGDRCGWDRHLWLVNVAGERGWLPAESLAAKFSMASSAWCRMTQSR